MIQYKDNYVYLMKDNTKFKDEGTLSCTQNSPIATVGP